MENKELVEKILKILEDKTMKETRMLLFEAREEAEKRARFSVNPVNSLIDCQPQQ